MKAVRLVLFLLAASGAAVAPAAAQAQSSTGAPAAGGAPVVIASPFTQNPFLGGVPSGTATSQPLSLSIGDAINRALEHNLGVLTSEQGQYSAAGSRLLALSELLPNVNGHVSESRQVINLAAYGFPLPPGTPALVGPFNVFDARAGVSQAVFDLHALNNLRAASHDESAARFSYKSARDLVVLVAANGYLQALAASARAETAHAQLQTSQALYNQAVDLKNSGIVAGIDVLRAETQLNLQRQRATAADNDAEKSKLALARVIGLPIGQTIALATQLPYAPVPEMSLDQALERAYQARPDYLAALERVKSAEARRAAIVGEALPSVHVNADYGAIGLTVGTAEATYTIAGVLSIPIFNGGRTRARLQREDAELRSLRLQADDVKAGIYYDVRAAFLDLQSTGEQLQTAEQARKLADQQLAQSRDRFAAGVADNIEVIQAQQAVAVANEQYIGAQYSFNLSKAELARALGVAEQAVQQFLGGSR